VTVALQPRPGFNWLQVEWGAPDEPVSDRCSYCGDPFPDIDAPDYEIPLRIWRRGGQFDGWTAAFCVHCQAAWFGIQTFPEPHCEICEDAGCPACEGGDGGWTACGTGAALPELEGDAPEPDAPELGPCCICEREDGVRNIVMLERRCAVTGHGWGCYGCGLPPDGASAVLRDDCLALFKRDPSTLRLACRGYPGEDGRIWVDELPPEPFEHDMTKHEAADGRH
jgi:hypothetical protein